MLSPYESYLSKLSINHNNSKVENYSKILPNLYIGNERAAENKSLMNKLKVTAILNCTPDVPNFHHFDEKFEYMRIPVDDDLKQRDFALMYKFTPSLIEFIHKHRSIQKGCVFIHCVQGRQRSCYALLVYLVDKLNMTPHEALKKIITHRKEAFFYGSSFNFVSTFEQFVKSL